MLWRQIVNNNNDVGSYRTQNADGQIGNSIFRNHERPSAAPVGATFVRRGRHCRLIRQLSSGTYSVRQKKGTALLLRINLLIHNVTWQNLVLLLLTNNMVDVIYQIYVIYTNFRTFYAKSTT